MVRTAEYARTHPDDPDLAEVVERVSKARAAYLRWGGTRSVGNVRVQIAFDGIATACSDVRPHSRSGDLPHQGRETGPHSSSSARAAFRSAAIISPWSARSGSSPGLEVGGVDRFPRTSTPLPHFPGRARRDEPLPGAAPGDGVKARSPLAHQHDDPGPGSRPISASSSRNRPPPWGAPRRSPLGALHRR